MLEKYLGTPSLSDLENKLCDRLIFHNSITLERFLSKRYLNPIVFMTVSPSWRNKCRSIRELDKVLKESSSSLFYQGDTIFP